MFILNCFLYFHSGDNAMRRARWNGNNAFPSPSRDTLKHSTVRVKPLPEQICIIMRLSTSPSRFSLRGFFKYAKIDFRKRVRLHRGSPSSSFLVASSRIERKPIPVRSEPVELLTSREFRQKETLHLERRSKSAREKERKKSDLMISKTWDPSVYNWRGKKIVIFTIPISFD